MSKFEVRSDGKRVEVNWLQFPGGEYHPQINTNSYNYNSSPVSIGAQITDADGIIQLLLLNDALRRSLVYTKTFNLFLGYFPYARQDRVANPGEALGVKVMADLINSCNFNEVTVLDVHSPVALALINKVKNVSAFDYVKKLMYGHEGNLILVSPDTGAEKRVFEIAKELRADMITATKHRNTQTGEISSVRINTSDLNCVSSEKGFLVVDDICDGGRTFVELGKKLNQCTTRPIYLYVSHGIFSKGLDVFKDYFKKIYCPNVWPNIEDHPLLERI